jgi:hypothetical protein
MNKDQPSKPLKNTDFLPSLSRSIQRFWRQFLLVCTYMIIDLKKGPLQFKIAVFSIFLIVTFMTILLNANSIIMVMFLGIAEVQAGDTDFILTPSITSAAPTITSSSFNLS